MIRSRLYDDDDVDSKLDMPSFTPSYNASSAPAVLPSPVVVGDFCVSKFAEDGQFYRAVVEKLTGDRATLRYVDWGNLGTDPTILLSSR